MRKDDEYLNFDFNDIEVLPPLGRRDFLKLFGGGIIVLFSSRDSEAFQEQRRRMGFRQQAATDLNAFLRIGEDGKVTCFTGKIEMGQGVITSLAQMLAEELDVPLDSVQMVMGDTDLCPWDMGTFGSLSTRYFGPTFRAAAAEAKAVLIELAADALQTPLTRLKAKDGLIIDKANPKNKVSYAALTKGKKIERHLKKKPALKPVPEFTIVGKPLLRRDALEKVTGKAQFAGDIRLPGMLYAKILRPPAHRAKLVEVDTSAAEKIKGIKIVKDGNLTAALHENPEEAERALGKIKAQFETEEAKVDDKTIFAHLLKVAPQGQTVVSRGNIETGKNLAVENFEQTYLNSYVAHATIETHTAAAKIEGDKITVWASTQIPFSAKDAVAQAIGFPAEKVRIITPFVGGGFGGKGRNNQAVEAARLAKLTGKPVQVMWNRGEEFFYDSFRPAAVVKINSGIKKTGKIAFWDYHVCFAGERGAAQFYEIAHHRTLSYGTSHRGGWRGTPGSHPFTTGAWRAPAANTNAFARESQIDIMAAKAGMDPLEFRLKNLKDERMIRALKAAAERFGWKPAKAPSGRGYGLACAVDAGSYVAHMAEVEVDKKKGYVQVKRVVCAQDMGLVVNPEGAKLQIEGCIMMGLGYALTEEIHFKGGKILDLNFDTYKIPRFSWLPKIETVLIENKDLAPQGCGEPAVVCMGAVVANAIYDASGTRLFQLPMTPERIKAATA